MTYHAHSAGASGKPQSQAEHLSKVARKASDFAEPLGMREEAELAGLLHDAGKYSELFQRRLEGLEHGLDHWSPGAHLALFGRRLIAAALAIQGHHIGLQQSNKQALNGLYLSSLAKKHPLGLRLSETDPGLVLDRLRADGLVLPEVHAPCLPGLAESAAAMLDVRMLYSTLVDADFLDTEGHMKAGDEHWSRPDGLPLEPRKAFDALLKHMAKLRDASKASQHVNSMRDDLFGTCVKSADRDCGLCTLTAPTGTGKTLSMLAFALRHAIRNDLRRIVFVIPYLSIIEQTAKEYREIFEPVFGMNYVLEHHSLAETGAGDEMKATWASDHGARLLAENWDAPIIITTSVQMLESLFSNRPSACRKLHRLAESAILFDEVQTLPTPLAVATLAGLSHLSKRYGTSVVLSTATQPAFTHLDGEVRKLNAGSPGWRPEELVPDKLMLFDRARRTRVIWPEVDERMSWAVLAAELATHKQVLCVVNLKRHAHSLIAELKESASDGIFHLSTSMCPAHRMRVIARVKRLLEDKGQCKLISTQCIEAGVDVDFPQVYRAFADLTSVAQAAGRCNRNGLGHCGIVRVFTPEDEKYPGGGYEQAADITRQLLRDKGASGMDINDTHLYQEYYQRLYDLARLHDGKTARELGEAVDRQDFVAVASLYRVINQDTINVLVPYCDAMDQFDMLAGEVRDVGLTGGWIRRARPLTVSLYRPREGSHTWERLEHVRIGKNDEASDWFIYCDPKDYDKNVGLIPPDGPALWLA